MRWSLLLLIVAIPTLAFAEPKVAIAPFDGDDGGRMADVVADAAGDRAKVTKQGRVEGAMRSMGVSVLSSKSLKKLRTKLDVDVVIYGSVEKDGGDKRLSLQLAGDGKSKLEVAYKNAAQLRKDLAAKLPKRIAAAMEGNGDDEEDEEDARAQREAEERKKREEEEERKREEERRAEDKRKKQEEEDRRKRDEEEARRAERKRKDDGDKRKKKRGEDDEDDEDGGGAFGEDEPKKKKKKKVASRDDDEDEDDDSGSARKRLGDEEEAEEDEQDQPRKKRKRARRHVLTQTALWADAGAAFARRTLTWASTGTMRPPAVGTAAPAVRIEGEVYPAAFSSLKGPAAGIGVVGSYNRSFALGIAVPGTQIVTPIKNGHISVGARYRFVFGAHSVAAGLSYWRSYYLADRSKLMNADQLDMPDVDYTGVAPGVAVRIGITPIVSAFTTIDVPLVLKSGPIQNPNSYGAAKITAFDVRAGAQVMLASHVALQVGIDFEQVNLAFTGQTGSKASARMVSKATDRSVGLGATIGVTY